MSHFLSRTIERWLEKRNLFVLHRIDGQGIGDVLCMTALIKRVGEERGYRFIVVSKYPDVFLNNPRVFRNVAFNRLGPLSKPVAKWFVRRVKNSRVGCFNYRGGADVPRPQWLEDHRRRVSLIQIFSEHMGICNDYADLRNEIFLTAEECDRFSAELALPKEFALIKPTGPTNWTPVKEWGIERFQEIVAKTPHITWVQTGEQKDAALEGVIDLRGQTSLRQLFYVISRARFVLSVEGVYNHIASAFDVPSFVVFSGLHHPEIARYGRTIPIVRTPQVDCSPCWLTTPCPVPGKPCTNDITPHQVVETIRDYFSRTAQART